MFCAYDAKRSILLSLLTTTVCFPNLDYKQYGQLASLVCACPGTTQSAWKMVNIGVSTCGVIASYRAVARDVTINKIYFRVAKYEQKRHNLQAHYVAKTSNRLLSNCYGVLLLCLWLYRHGYQEQSKNHARFGDKILPISADGVYIGSAFLIITIF